MYGPMSPGPWNDPIRQQGRELAPKALKPKDWYETPQPCDRSRMARRRRMYHSSYQTSSGHTWDEYFERLSETAREMEEAGIDLGWGHAKAGRVNESCPADAIPQSQRSRREFAGRPSAFMSTRTSTTKPTSKT